MRAFWVAAVIVAIDQAAKITVVRTMHLGQSIPVLGDWLQLTYTENPGMAFGITVGPAGLITVFALIATVLIGGYLYRLRGQYAPYRYSLGFILGGALGNIIDRLFYGLIYGYDVLFQGRVVDFIHVNVWQGYVDPWASIPFMNGRPWAVALFPIWNVADMAIVGGVVGILLFQRRFHQQMEARRRAEQHEGEEASAPAERISEDEEAPPLAAREEGPPHIHPGEDRSSDATSRPSEA